MNVKTVRLTIDETIIKLVQIEQKPQNEGKINDIIQEFAVNLIFDEIVPEELKEERYIHILYGLAIDQLQLDIQRFTKDNHFHIAMDTIDDYMPDKIHNITVLTELKRLMIHINSKNLQFE